MSESKTKKNKEKTYLNIHMYDTFQETSPTRRTNSILNRIDEIKGQLDALIQQKNFFNDLVHQIDIKIGNASKLLNIQHYKYRIGELEVEKASYFHKIDKIEESINSYGPEMINLQRQLDLIMKKINQAKFLEATSESQHNTDTMNSISKKSDSQESFAIDFSDPYKEKILFEESGKKPYKKPSIAAEFETSKSESRKASSNKCTTPTTKNTDYKPQYQNSNTKTTSSKKNKPQDNVIA